MTTKPRFPLTDAGKTCTICLITKPLDQFPIKSANKSSGRTAACRFCLSSKSSHLSPSRAKAIRTPIAAKWRDANREHYRKYQREYQREYRRQRKSG